MAQKDSYNWLDDPFNDKKASSEQEGMSSGTKMAVGCGCLIAIIAIVALILFAGMGILDILTDM